MCVRLDLLAESSRRRLEVGGWFDGVVQVKSEVPGAYDTVATAGISISMSICLIRAVVKGMVVGGDIQYGVVGIDSQAVDA